jgi:galactose mutarotase-like enzyme
MLGRVTETIEIAAGGLEARVAARGAQLVSLRRGGVRYLYEGDEPRFWAKSAPILFPVVGRCAGDRIVAEGVEHPMPRHGFARDLDFEAKRVEPTEALFALADSDATRRHYPYPFELLAEYRAEEGRLQCLYTVRNRGDRPMPFSFGLHPAFRWPLDDSPRESWRVRFPRRMTADRIFLRDGLRSERRERVLDGGMALPLSDDLFAEDALVLRTSVDRLVLESPASPRSVELRFDACTWLGIWSLPRAPFLCLEPWRGVAGAHGDTGELRTKEGVESLPPGAHFRYSLAIFPR